MQKRMWRATTTSWIGKRKPGENTWGLNWRRWSCDAWENRKQVFRRYRSLSQPTLKGWSRLQEEPVRYFLTGNFRTGQETWITLRKRIYFFLLTGFTCIGPEFSTAQCWCIWWVQLFILFWYRTYCYCKESSRLLSTKVSFIWNEPYLKEQSVISGARAERVGAELGWK